MTTSSPQSREEEGVGVIIDRSEGLGLVESGRALGITAQRGHFASNGLVSFERD